MISIASRCYSNESHPVRNLLRGVVVISIASRCYSDDEWRVALADVQAVVISIASRCYSNVHLQNGKGPTRSVVISIASRCYSNRANHSVGIRKVTCRDLYSVTMLFQPGASPHARDRDARS